MKHPEFQSALMFFVCFASLVSASSADTSDTRSGKRIVVENYYYARPGKAEEVYQWRLHASDVRAKLGLPKGRVLKRVSQPAGGPDSTDLPDVVWECEYPSLAARNDDVERLGKRAEFEQVEKHMDTLIRRFERAIFELTD